VWAVRNGRSSDSEGDFSGGGRNTGGTIQGKIFRPIRGANAMCRVAVHKAIQVKRLARDGGLRVI